MPSHVYYFWGLFLSSLPLHFVHSTFASHVYIVYLGLTQYNDPYLTSNSHIQLLSSVFSSEQDAKRSMLYSYKHAFSGFSARLSSTQAASLAKIEGVISVLESRSLELHTTRSWDFLGLPLENINKNEGTPLQLAYGSDTIVAVLDSGVWPESESFKEEPFMGPIPPCWKGNCVKGENFDPAKACNRKLIGARYYVKGFEEAYGPLNMSSNKEYRSARDFIGHGTHTASTAVGSRVRNANYFGIGQGTARGGAPRARLAVYKVCWSKDLDGKCNEADILAAFDDALCDGVHVISASFGESPPLRPFFASNAGIGSFHAMQLGVTVVFSAGNDGPQPSLVGNVAPWSISVAASSIDRAFPTEIIVNGDFSIMGEGLISTEINAKLADATNYFDDGVCSRENWNKIVAKRPRVVLCFSTVGSVDIGEAEQAVMKANASGLIFAEPGASQMADVDIIPTVRLDMVQATKLKDYFAQFENLPPVQIKPSQTSIGKVAAPTVAYFSSRGPSSISPDILKPDITAPGIGILAAWPPKTPPTLLPEDRRSVKWNFQSGTSMSCPHVSGVVALIKSAHPNWSPAVIRSALMTTACTRDSTLDTILDGGSMQESNPFDVGAGHLNPLRAMDPGLVYDIKPNDYISFLCNIGYSQDKIKKIVLPTPGMDTRCSSKRNKAKTANINYPSITVSNLRSTTTVKRTVRNVGRNRNAIYFACIVKPDGVEVMVWPRTLIFTVLREEVSYYVTVRAVKKSEGRYDFGEIVWSDGFHYVRSPLVVHVNNTLDCNELNSYTGI
ncbi:hypothetical protein Pint_31471 [Pistacia integerrima]|uniref:Uncharacterized protein n=1 Tax=Pistacia integerrima TaxID=434235 RepID=A0ACC0XTE5_9ROSI|nr:hypothetical protein Pint_31471 [Pistacia integerrima]